ncbi:MAG: hypothetical protein AABY51_03710 [Deltaproteobacteria bacterium]
MRTIISLTLMLSMIFCGLSASLAQDQPCADASEAGTRLRAVTALIDSIPDMRAKDDPALKITLKEMYVELVKLNLEKPTSADVYFQMARYYRFKSQNWSAMKHLDKALFFNPLHTGSLVLRGDIYSERFKDNFQTGFEDSYKRAKINYEAALKVEGLAKEVEADIYLKLGDLNDIYELPAKKAEAREYWNKAALLAPGSAPSKAAIVRLGKSGKTTDSDGGA